MIAGWKMDGSNCFKDFRVRNLGLIGSISVSGQLSTYPSPNSTTVNLQQVKINVGLGEGWVGSCQDTDIDPNN